MKITIYGDNDISVEGGEYDSAEDVANAYKKAISILKQEEKE